MKVSMLPSATIVGRIANRLRLKTSKDNYHYVQILMYYQNGGHADLIPTIAFGTTALRMVREAKQGDLIKIETKIDPINNKGYISLMLVASQFSFLESSEMRSVYNGKVGKQLKVLFPVVPDNYHVSKHKSKAQPRRPKSQKQSDKPKTEPKSKPSVKQPQPSEPTQSPVPKTSPRTRPVHSVHAEVIKPKIINQNTEEQKAKRKFAESESRHSNVIEEATRLTSFKFPDYF